jgi:sugar transferase (PEP-CTERM system associated)
MAQKIILLVLGDVLVSMLALYIAFLMRTVWGWGAQVPGPLEIFIFVSVTLFSSYFLELYSRKKVFRINLKEMPAIIVLGLAVSFFVLTSVFFILPSLALFGRRTLLLSLGIYGLLQFVWHFSYQSLLNLTGMKQNVLVLGTGDLARKMEQIMFLHRTHYTFAGYYNLLANSGEDSSSPLKASCEGLVDIIKKEKIDKLVVSMQERRGVFPLQELLSCKFAGVDIVDAPSFYEEVMGKMLIENITPGWFIFADGFKLNRTVKFFKRIYDVIFATIGLILTFPLFPLIALLIKIDSEGPVFYRQLRVGEGEINISLIKFRTMKQNAETQTGAVWAQKNDKRVTKIGSVLRKLRLDELPQFINVLKGEMSFIGPRPERPEFVAKLKQTIPYYVNRHFVKPGITGWAQIKYQYGASEEDAFEKLRYDLYYIKNLSPLLDCMITIDTIKVVLFGKGAR